MEVFVDIITRSGDYVPAKTPTWIDAGVGKVVPFACRYALRSGLNVGGDMGVYHVEETRYLDWPGFTESCVRNFDTIVVVASIDPAFDDGKGVEGFWLVTDGIERRAYFEARAKLRAFENGRRHAAG
jgi:hypothetical protein